MLSLCRVAWPKRSMAGCQFYYILKVEHFILCLAENQIFSQSISREKWSWQRGQLLSINPVHFTIKRHLVKWWNVALYWHCNWLYKLFNRKTAMLQYKGKYGYHYEHMWFVSVSWLILSNTVYICYAPSEVWLIKCLLMLLMLSTTNAFLILYYSTGVQIVSCTLSDDSVLSERTGLFNPVLCVSQGNLFWQKESANESVSFKSG